MPDDQVITEQYDEEAEGAFEEEPSEETEKKEEKPEGEKTSEENFEEDPEKKEPEKKEPEKNEPKTAKDRLDERLKTVEEDDETPPEDKKPPEEKKDPEKPPEPEKKPDKKWTKEQVAEKLSIIADDELPEEVIIGDETVNVRGYAEQYPDEFAAVKVIASQIAERIVERQLSALKYAKPEDIDGKTKEFDGKVGKVEHKVAQLSFDSAVARAVDDSGNLKHPDYYQIIYGPGKKDFIDWVKSQDAKIQRLANSLDPADGVLILDYFKEATAKVKVKEHDEKLKKKKQEYDDIHSSTSRTDKHSRRPAASDGPKTKDEAEKEAQEAFEEDDK